MSDEPAPPDTPDAPVPKLPYGRGLRFSGPELFRIAMTIMVLVAVIALAKPCSNAVSSFVTGFGSGSAATAAGSNATATAPIGSDLIPLKGMTDEQVKATVENAQQRARVRANTAAAATGSGSATAARPAPATGSATATGSAK